MSAPLFVIAIALLFAPWAVAAGLWWHQIDRPERQMKHWRTKARVADAQLEETVAQWGADTDAWALRELEHETVCLGTRVVPNDTRCN